jgi:hypothetical protein
VIDHILAAVTDEKIDATIVWTRIWEDPTHRPKAGRILRLKSSRQVYDFELFGIRAALCHDIYSAHQSVEHDDVNVLALGAQVVGPAVAHELVEAFLEASSSGRENHRRRVDKIKAWKSVGERS